MTKNLQKRIILSLGIFFLMFLSSCGWLRKEQGQKEQVQKEQVQKEQVQKEQVQKETDYVDMQAQIELEEGKFQKAIDLCKEIYQKYPQDPTVRSGYIKTLESIKSGGDRAFEKRDFALAGYVYGLLIKNYSSVGQLNGSLSFNREGLTARIGNCKKILFENGLKQYRSGNLNQAIFLWKSILVFDPENQEIKKAVDMASLQSKNLQKTK
jgi:tetratricopeptide (TPR) repeat protein